MVYTVAASNPEYLEAVNSTGAHFTSFAVIHLPDQPIRVVLLTSVSSTC